MGLDASYMQWVPTHQLGPQGPQLFEDSSRLPRPNRGFPFVQSVIVASSTESPCRHVLLVCPSSVYLQCCVWISGMRSMAYYSLKSIIRTFQSLNSTSDPLWLSSSSMIASQSPRPLRQMRQYRTTHDLPATHRVCAPWRHLRYSYNNILLADIVADDITSFSPYE